MRRPVVEKRGGGHCKGAAAGGTLRVDPPPGKPAGPPPQQEAHKAHCGHAASVAQEMSREEVTAFLRSVQLSLDTLQRQLDSGVSELPNVSREALPLFLHQQKLALTQAFAGQLEEWQSFEEDTGLGEVRAQRHWLDFP